MARHRRAWLRMRAALAFVVLSASFARAAPIPPPSAPTQMEQAAAHSRDGQLAYVEGRYPDALREFELGYALSPRPEFLINFAQVHRKLGRLGDATIDCERYLATSPPVALRDEVSRLLVAIREEQALSATPRPAPEVPVAAKPVELVTAPMPPPQPARRSHRAALIGGLVAGSVVVIGVAITLGVVLTRSEHYPSSALQGDFR